MLRLDARGASQPGARAIRIDGISPLGSRSVTRSPANDSRGRCAPRAAGNRWLSSRVPYLECIELTDGAWTSLNLGAKGWRRKAQVLDIDGGGGSKMLEQWAGDSLSRQGRYYRGRKLVKVLVIMHVVKERWDKKCMPFDMSRFNMW